MHRRHFLSRAAGLAWLPWLARASRAAVDATPTTLRLDLVNRSGRFADSELWMYVVGTDLTTGHNSYLRVDGTLAACALSDVGPDGYADYSMSAAAFRGLLLPRMSGRIYVAIGSKLTIRPVADAGQPGGVGVQLPAGCDPTRIITCCTTGSNSPSTAAA